MKNKKEFLVILCFLTLVFLAMDLKAQSAIKDLEDLTGQHIDLPDNSNYNPDSPRGENPAARVSYKAEFGNFLAEYANEYNEKGLEHYNRGEFSEALRLFKIAGRLRPDNATYKTNINVAAAQKEKFKAYERQIKEWNEANANKYRQAAKERKQAIANKKRQAEELKKANAELRSETTKTLKNLNAAAYWSKQSADVLLEGLEVTKYLETSMEKARQYGQFAEEAMQGRIQRDTPPFKVSVPDVPPPVDANPQIKVYNYVIEQTKILVPAIIETEEKLEKTQQSIADNQKAASENRAETERLVSEMIKTKDGEEKNKMIAKYEKNNEEYDALVAAANLLNEDATGLETELEKNKKKVDDIKETLAALQANPESAAELLQKVNEDKENNE